MIVVVTGSRSFIECPYRAPVKAHFFEIIHGLKPTAVFHGGAVGPDAWAAGEFNEIQKVFRPDPADDYFSAREALFKRNHDMIDFALRRQAWQEQAILVACWDGTSRGTKDAIDHANSVKMAVVSVPVDLIKSRWLTGGML